MLYRMGLSEESNPNKGSNALADGREMIQSELIKDLIYTLPYIVT